MSRRVLVLACLLAALVAAGCGVGAGEQSTGAQLTVTRDFGDEQVGRVAEASTPSGDTVLRLLQRRFDVETRFGGAYVQAIEGIAGGERRGRPADWFFYVNGIEAGTGAGARRVAAGDRIWWDLHDWGGAMRVPAVVGSFPEPFRSGVEGKRFPVRLECTDGGGEACDEVEERLNAAGVRQLARGALAPDRNEELLRVVVGPWEELRRDPSLRVLESGPEASGVYARFRGNDLVLLDERGEAQRALGAGTGLVAATRFGEAQPTWVVTGTDRAGVAAAAASMEEGTLRNRFAMAVEDGKPVALPVRPAGRP